MVLDFQIVSHPGSTECVIASFSYDYSCVEHGL